MRTFATLWAFIFLIHKSLHSLTAVTSYAGWLALNNLIPGLFLPLVLFASIFWLTSFVMAVIAKLRTPKDTPESRP